MTRTMQGLERFAEDLPVVDHFVTLGEGDTPLLNLDVLARRLGLRRLSAKMETQNPTGSYKDRVAAMSASLARQRGNQGWIGTSSGNAGLAMAAYGTRAGLPGFLCMVASAPPEKRIPLMPYAVEVLSVEGVARGSSGTVAARLFDLVRMASEQHDLFLGITAHAFNPDGMRGIDTISYELAEQAPDMSHVYVPTGGGGLLAAVARGLEHRRIPARVIACQPSGCAPVVGFVNDLLPRPFVQRCDTDVSALQLPEPPDGDLAAAAVSASRGWGTAADDEEILSAQGVLAEAEGIFVEPASAASLAALVHDAKTGLIGRDDHPVLILTGAGWKDLGRFSPAAAQTPVVNLSEIEHRIDTWTRDQDSLAATSTRPAEGLT